MRSNTVIGITLGIVFGLFIDGLMLLFLNEWLVVLIVPIILPLIVGIVIGVLLLRRLPTLPWWYLLGVMLIGVFLINAPHKFVHWRLVTLADELPVYPGATMTDRLVIEGCSDNSAPWVDTTYAVNASTDEVRDYMLKEFNRTWLNDQEFGDQNTFFSSSGDQRVVLDFLSDSTFKIYLEVYKFCGKK